MTQAQIESIYCWKLICSAGRFIGMVAMGIAVTIPTALILSIF